MKLTIITVAFNSAGTIRACLESVRCQSIDVEHIVIDGGSKDGTIEIVEEFCPELSLFISEPDKGIYDAMNKGLNIATGDVIGILNSDDIYATENILAEVAFAFENRNVESCYGDLIYMDANMEYTIRFWQSGVFEPKKFYWGWMPPHPTFFVRRTVYEKYGVFNLDLGSAADYEIILRFLLKQKIETIYIPKVMVKMRTGGISNASLKNRFNANRNDRKAWDVNGLKPYPWTFLMKPVRKIPQWFK